MPELEEGMQFFLMDFPNGSWAQASHGQQKGYIILTLDGLESGDYVVRQRCLHILRYIALGSIYICIIFMHAYPRQEYMESAPLSRIN
jgi:hypothetical protein